MDRIWIALKRGFGGLADFSGRSSRTDFWFYAIFITLIAGGIWAFVMGLEVNKAFAEINEFAAKNPDNVKIVTSATGQSVSIKPGNPDLGPDFGYLIAWISVITAMSIALVSASAVRRLHDSNRTGLWVLLPMPFLFGGFWLMRSVSVDFQASIQPNMGTFFLAFINNLIYLVSLGFLAFLLLRSGTAGENRFGIRDTDEAV